MVEIAAYAAIIMFFAGAAVSVGSRAGSPMKTFRIASPRARGRAHAGAPGILRIPLDCQADVADGCRCRRVLPAAVPQPAAAAVPGAARRDGARFAGRLGPFDRARDLAGENDDALDETLRGEHQLRLVTALASYSAKDRTFLHLCYGQKRPPEAVARAPGVSLKTVYAGKHQLETRLFGTLDALAGSAFPSGLARKQISLPPLRRDKIARA